MKIEKAIKLLLKKYGEAILNPLVKKPVSWALYHTWDEINRKEKVRDNERDIIQRQKS